MEIIFLGTSSMVPTKDRSHSAILLKGTKENILIDCGEGTQRQLQRANQSIAKITHLFISHWHGDHVLGIPGLAQTMSATAPEKELLVFGPKKTKEYIKKMFQAFSSSKKVMIKATDLLNKKTFETSEFIVTVAPLKHGVDVLGYSIQQKPKIKIDLAKIKKLGIPKGPLLGKLQQGRDITFKGKKVKANSVTKKTEGKKIAIIPDTSYCSNAVSLAKNAGLLICESTYDLSLKEKAQKHNHLTATDAATIAKKAGAKKLVLTHFSARYKDTKILEKEAKKIFKNTVCAKDLLKVKV